MITRKLARRVYNEYHELIAAAANSLKIEEATLLAIILVESQGRAFDKKNRLTLDFDLARFNSLAAIENNSSGLRSRFWKAMRSRTLFAHTAEINLGLSYLCSAIGVFRVGVAHYGALGYSSSHAMYEAYRSNVSVQFDSFVKYVEAYPQMHRALKDKHWATFAMRHRSPRALKDNYSKQLEKVYKLCKSLHY